MPSNVLFCSKNRHIGLAFGGRAPPRPMAPCDIYMYLGALKILLLTYLLMGPDSSMLPIRFYAMKSR